MSDEEFEKYQMFQQFQATQITPFSSIAILAQSDNPTVYFTFKAPNTWIIDTGAPDHITGNKDILHFCFHLLSLLSVTNKWYYVSC